MKRKFLSCILTAVFCLGAAACTRAEVTEPDNVGGMPLRAALEAEGYQVSWNGEDKSIVAFKDGERLVFKPDSAEVSVNGNPITMNSALILKEGVSYLPKNALISLGITDYDGSLAYRINEQMDFNSNYVFSPFSLKAALAMTANGAQGAGREEIVRGLGYTDLDSLNEDMKMLIDRYNGDGEAEMSVADSVWVNEIYPEISDNFKTALDEYYSAEVQKTSAADYTEKTNKWIKEKSRGLQDIYLETDANFVMSLINTTYLKADWINKFDANADYDDTFLNADGSEGSITYMQNTLNTGVYTDEDVTMVRLDYKDENRNLSFYAAMADPLTDLEAYVSKLEDMRVNLSLPKFKGHSTITMNDIVKGLGITSIFSENADLGNIFSENVKNLYVSNILQDTLIDVNEEGTEAASTTVVTVENTAVLEPPMELKFNKPFTYFVMDNDSGEILFMGRLANAE